MMFPLGYTIAESKRAALEEAYSKKKEYLSKRIAPLYASTNPAALWNAIVKHRLKKEPDGDFVDSYDDLVLSYEGYHNMVYEILFQTTPEEEAVAKPQVKEWRRSVYFNHPFLSPATFLAFARSSSGAVAAVPLYAFAAKRLLLFRIRVELELDASAPPPAFLGRAQRVAGGRLPCPPSASSPLSNGLTQEDIEMFIADLVPNLRLVRDMPPWMLPYYLCHASRKFMFMCDTRGVGAIPIDVFMKSEVFSELLRMFESDAQDAIICFPEGSVVEVPASVASDGTDADADDTVPALVLSFEGSGNRLKDVYQVQLLDSDVKVGVTRDRIYWSTASMDYVSPDLLSMDNWFSLALMSRIYEHFTALDTDGDGVLTREELSHYSNDSFTQLSIQRVFECHVSHSGNRHIMDYKTYLNFVIATEHAATRPAMRYIWALLDLDGTKTHIKISTLHCFCKEIANELIAKGLMVDISAQSILSEIVDMINPAWHEWVTFDDIEKSGQQATVLPVLLSYRNFYAYDCREQTAASANDEFADVPEK
jgi:Ca2+-binding EF-hand superfamily protein